MRWLVRWRYPLMYAWLAALAAMPLLQGGQDSGLKWFGGFAWESFGLLVGLVVWCTVRGRGVVSTIGAQRALAVVGLIGAAMLALSVAICASEGPFMVVVLRLAGVSGAVAEDAVRSGSAELFAFMSAFLCAYCCTRIGHMCSLGAAVALPVDAPEKKLPGFPTSVVAFFGGVLFAAVLFWGYAPGIEGEAYSGVAWAATVGCFAVVVSIGMLALCPGEYDEVKVAPDMRGRIQAMLDGFEDDNARVRFVAFCVCVVVPWVTGACLLVLVSVVSGLPGTVPGLVRWALAMALLVDVLALAFTIGHVQAGSLAGRLPQLVALPNLHKLNDANEESQRGLFDGIAQEHAYGVVGGRGVSMVETMRSHDLSLSSASCGASCEANAMKAFASTLQSSASATVGEGSAARSEPALSASLKRAVYQHGLTERERESLAWVLAGLTSSEAAERMGLKASTVRVYVQRGCRKLGTTDCDEVRSRFASQPSSDEPAGVCEKVSYSLGGAPVAGAEPGKDASNAVVGKNGSGQPSYMQSCLAEHCPSLARVCATIAAASGLAAIALLFVPTMVAGSLLWVGEGAYVGCAAALFLVAAASLFTRSGEEVENAEKVMDSRGCPVSNSDDTRRLNFGEGFLASLPLALIVRKSRVAACGFGVLTVLLGCTCTALLWFTRSEFGVWPAITLATSLAFTLCTIVWGSVLMSKLGLLRENEVDSSSVRLSICIGCCVPIVASLLLQAGVPWACFAMAAAAIVVFAGLSVAAVSLRGGFGSPPEASPSACVGSGGVKREVYAQSRFLGEAAHAARWFTLFCATMGFMWSRLWEGRTTSYLGLVETLFAVAVVVILCAFFAAQSRGRSRVAVAAFVIVCCILYTTGTPAVIVYASILLPVLFVLWCNDEGLFCALSLQWFALAFAVGAFVGLAYAVGVENNTVLGQELYAAGLGWALSFVQLAMAAFTLLALVGLGLSCRLVAVERHACVATRELEAVAWKGQVCSYLVGRGLSPLQTDVVVGIVQGMTTVQIATMLSYSAGSINTARFVAYRMLNVHNRAHLVELLARETGLANMHQSAADRRIADANDMLQRK